MHESILDLDSDYFKAISTLSKENDDLEFDDKTVFVSELVYCEKRRGGAVPSMTLGIERDAGVKYILRKIDIKKQKEAYELLKKRWELKQEEMRRLEEIVEEIRSIQRTETFVFLAPERNDKVIIKEVEVNGEKYKIVGSPDFIAVNVKPIKYYNYVIPPLSPIPVEKKTGIARTGKYMIALMQGMIYAYLLNSPAFVIQSDWIRQISGEYYTVTNDLFIFVPFFDEEVMNSFKERLKRRILLAVNYKNNSKRETWKNECERIKMAGLGVYALKTTENKRKDENKIMNELIKIGLLIAKEDGLKVPTQNVLLQLITKNRKELTNYDIRHIIKSVAQEIQETEGTDFVEFDRLGNEIGKVIECIKKNGYEVSSMLEEQLTNNVRNWILMYMSRTGEVEIFSHGIKVLENTDTHRKDEIDKCLELWQKKKVEEKRRSVKRAVVV